MKIKCRACHDFFDIPDGKKITRAVCPFCEHVNDLREPEMPASASSGQAEADSALAQPRVPTVRHPLAPQFWILAICALIVTTIICISFLFTVIELIETGAANEKMMDELNKATQQINSTMDKTTKEMQRSLQHVLKP